jgi:putative membrane protein insertion efficiency factor
MKKVFLKLIQGYQFFISPYLGSNCRFYPSCSSYTTETIEKYGVIKGLAKGFVRLLKCNPFYKGGVDLP